MKKTVLIQIVLCAVLALFLASCMSLQQDVSVSAEQVRDNGFSDAVARRLATVDAAWFEKSSMDYTRERNEIILEIDTKISESPLEKSLEARLLALKGRALFLSGDTAGAKRLYAQAERRFASDREVMILGNRLGVKLLSPYDWSEENALLILECALTKYAQGKYDESAGLFDTAFLSLPDVYRSSYKNIRDRAWSLREAVSGNPEEARLLVLERMTLSQMMEVAQVSGDALNAYTGGEHLSGRRLFDVLVRAGLMDCISAQAASAGKEKLSPGDVATRLLCARFLWNLYAYGQGSPFAATKYSEKYRGRTVPESPVEDIPLDSPDFDAVLGCVEHEFMSLVDGTNFMPQGTVPAVEFRNGIKGIR